MNLFQYFDILGIFAFTFLIIDALIEIRNGRKDFRVLARLIIGISGLIIDGFLVFIYKG